MHITSKRIGIEEEVFMNYNNLYSIKCAAHQNPENHADNFVHYIPLAPFLFLTAFLYLSIYPSLPPSLSASLSIPPSLFQAANGGGAFSDYSSSVPSTPSISQREMRIETVAASNTPTPIRKQSKRRSNIFTVSMRQLMQSTTHSHY